MPSPPWLGAAAARWSTRSIGAVVIGGLRRSEPVSVGISNPGGRTVAEWVGFANPLCHTSRVTPAMRTPTPRECSVAGALDVVGEKWSLLVVRELFLGSRRFND